MRIHEILNKANDSIAAELLSESWGNFSFKQKDQIQLIENELKSIFDEITKSFLFERELTIDEIGIIFDAAVSKAKSEGNRTTIGKATDVATIPLDITKKLDLKINELGKTIQNSEPVKNFKTKLETLKLNITSKNSDKNIIQLIQFLSEQAEKHPKTTTLVIGILTASATILSGPLGGIVAIFITKAISNLLQSEKISAALGSSLKVVTYDYLTGLTFKWISNEILENIVFAENSEVTTMSDSMKNINIETIKEIVLNSNPALAAFLNTDNINHIKYLGNINNFNFNYVKKHLFRAH